MGHLRGMRVEKHLGRPEFQIWLGQWEKGQEKESDVV